MRKALITGGVVLGVLLLVGAGTGYWIVFKGNTLDYEGARSVYIPRGASYGQALDSLGTDVLDSRRTFDWMARATGWGDQIKAGHYRIESGASNKAMLGKLRRGLQAPVSITIPPGTRPEVVAAVAGRDMAFTQKEFLSALRDTAFVSNLGTDTTHLFGHLRPETYKFYWLNSPKQVIRSIKEQADDHYSRMRAQADSLPVDLSMKEVLNLASIVQWETSRNEEKPRIAGVYMNRLQEEMPLQADPTVQYGILQKEGQKRRLLYEDYGLQHPYNTYNYRGLPPGPITNPSASSVRAVLNPESHDYRYFVAKTNGSGHTFSRTLSEHNRAADRYRQAMRQRRDSVRKADSSNAGS
jgi:UPF0755 protein